MRTQEGVQVQLCSFFNLGARWCGWLTPRPDHFTRDAWYRKLGQAQRLEPGTVQPVVSSYTI